MTGGKKKRKDLREGQAQYNEFANKALALQQPFAQAGVPAVNQLSAFSGLGTPEQSQAASDAFHNSLFYDMGNNEYQLANDSIKAGLSGNGLLYSQAYLNADALAKRQTYQNAFNSFLNNTGNVANVGIGAATNQQNTLLGQGNAAMGTATNIANTRQGFLGGLQQVANIGKTVADAYSGF